MCIILTHYRIIVICRSIDHLAAQRVSLGTSGLCGIETTTPWHGATPKQIYSVSVAILLKKTKYVIYLINSVTAVTLDHGRDYNSCIEHLVGMNCLMR